MHPRLSVVCPAPSARGIAAQASRPPPPPPAPPPETPAPPAAAPAATPHPPYSPSPADPCTSIIRARRGTVRAVRIVEIAYTPVKSLGLVYPPDVELTPTGVPANRRFYLMDERSQMVNGKRLGTLVQVTPSYDPPTSRLT